MKQQIKNLLKRHAAVLLQEYQARSNRRMFNKKFSVQTEQAHAMLYKNSSPKVLSGPFRGLAYFKEPVWGSIIPKWLGSYECELHKTIAEFSKSGYAAVIDVGCAEGYYAVGLARLLSSTPIYAYDTDPVSRRQVKKLALINGLSKNVHVETWCDHPAVQAIRDRTQGRLLLICDIEGGELEFLEPAACPALKHSDILVEIHDACGETVVGREIRERFAPTHHVEEVYAESRASWCLSSRSIPAFAGLSIDWLNEVTQEHRVRGRSWLWMRGRVPEKS